MISTMRMLQLNNVNCALTSVTEAVSDLYDAAEENSDKHGVDLAATVVHNVREAVTILAIDRFTKALSEEEFSDDERLEIERQRPDVESYIRFICDHLF